MCIFQTNASFAQEMKKTDENSIFLGCHSFAFSFFGSYEPTVLQILNRRYVTGTDKNIEPSDSQNDKMSKMRIDSYEYGYSEIHYIGTINISPYNHAFTSFDFFSTTSLHNSFSLTSIMSPIYFYPLFFISLLIVLNK